MTEAMPFLQKYDITFLPPPPLRVFSLRARGAPPRKALPGENWEGSPPLKKTGFQG